MVAMVVLHPPNPLLLTIVAAVAIQATWRRRAVYKAELKLLRLGRGDEPTVAQAAVLLRLTAARLLQQITNIPIPSTVLSSIRRALSPANGLAKRLRREAPPAGRRARSRLA
jgi:hypothetical protein